MSFPIHTPDTAPAGSGPLLKSIQSRYGFIPNLAAVFAESPGALKGLLAALQAYDDESLSLSPEERQWVLLSVSVENRCDYCAAAHGTLLHSMGVEKDEIVALQQDRPLSEPRLDALRRFTQAVVQSRGWPDEEVIVGFLDAGYTRAQVLEVMLGVSIKTLTNYANHIAQPPVNEQFAAFLPAWASAA